MSCSETFLEYPCLRSWPVVPDLSGKTAASGPAGGVPVFWRPVVDVASGDVAAMSAAPAWPEVAFTARHPVCAVLTPSRFSETLGGAVRKGLPATAVESVCRDYLTWIRRGDAPGFLLAALGAPRGVARAAQAAAGLAGRLGLDPARVALLFDCDDVLEAPLASLHAFLDLKRLGFRVGVGFSDIERLPYHFLEMLPADYLWVGSEADHGLFRQAPTSGACFADRLQSVCAFAENLLMDVIVAGVDSASKYHLLTDLRCRFGQGAYFPAVSPFGKSLGLSDTNGPPPGL